MERDRRASLKTYYKRMGLQTAERAMPKGNLGEKLTQLSKKGMSYAEAQRLDTLSRMPKIVR